MKHNQLIGTVILLCVFMLLGAGCSTQAELPERKMTIKLRHFWTKEHDLPVARIIEDVVRSYEADHPNVKIEFEGMDQTFYREQKLRSEMVTGNPPDILALFGGGEIEPYVRAERLIDLKPFLAERGMDKQFIDLSPWSFGDGIYGLPTEGFAEPIFYNKTIFAKLGIAPPESWDELLNAIKALKENGYIPFALGNNERWPGAIYYHYILHRNAGPELINQIVTGQESFNNPFYKAATEAFAELIEMDPFPKRSNDMSKEAAEELFMSGKAGMYLNGSWVINVLQGDSAAESFKNEVGVINFPSFDPAWELANGLTGGYTIGLALSSKLQGERLLAAYDLLEDIFAPEVQERMVYEAMRFPYSANVQVDYERTGPIFAELAELIRSTPHPFIAYDNLLPPSVSSTFFDVTQSLIEQEMDTGEVLKKMQESIIQYRELIRKGG
ncbi:ABC transporter substrate-binding protein [Paenibacillus sp. GXUN7292]|uniref:ABC transporter substrate-binding protein n=1 Tax=Paenibacillus sp. GXUN7292 TaxID=3422499 RepID=UPI003D7CF631